MRIFRHFPFTFLLIFLFAAKTVSAAPLDACSVGSEQDVGQKICSSDLKTEAMLVYSFIRTINPRVSSSMAYDMALDTVTNARRFDIPIPIIVGIQRTESDFNVFAVSSADARGPMQVLYPAWGPAIGIPPSQQWELHVPAINIGAGVRIFRHYCDIERGDVVKALYNYLGLPDGKLARMSPGKRLASKAKRLRYATKVIRTALEYRKFEKLALASGPIQVDR